MMTPEELKEYKRIYYLKNKQKNLEKRKQYYQDNKENIIGKVTSYREMNLDKIKETKHKHYIKNKKKIINKHNEYNKNKKKINPLFKLSVNIRTSIYNNLRKNGFCKNTKTEEILGCSFVEFKQHLESNFEDWMNWDNYGKYNGELNHGWDIDHIIPVSSATTEEKLLKLNHFSNLQPLCSKINRDIKRS